MAKKSRRQKLPTEKDFEKLNAPKAEESEPTPDRHFEQGREAPESRNLSTESDSQPTYSIDGAISVSLAGDITGAEDDEDSDDSVLDEESFEELYGESPQDFLRNVNATPLGEPVIEPITKPAARPTRSSAAAPADEPATSQEEPPAVDETADAPEEAAPAEEDNKPPEILILVGSPRRDGKSALFGRKLKEYLRMLGCAVTLFEVAKYPVAACTGCGVCSQIGECCIKGDAWGVLSRHMNSCAALVVIAPVYFAGPSGWLKAALDRCQMYWARKHVLKNWIPRRRPAHLVVIGEGGDPFGSEPLETICTSALNCADLRIEPHRIHRLIGDAFDLSYAVQIAGAVRAEIPRGR